MTTIVAVQGDNFAVVCSDSRIATVDEDGYVSQITTLREGNGKVAANGRYLLGAAGDMRAINLLHHVYQPPAVPPGTTGKKLDQFFTSKVIPSIRECFEQQGYALPDTNEKKHIAEHDSTILVVVGGNIYIIDGDYSWTSDAQNFYAVGTGSSYALGALQVTRGKSKLSIAQAKTLALKAINVAAKYDPHTGAPFHTFVQETSKSSKKDNVKPHKKRTK
jgi:ATP-dependent protease HslVU (ClpYQ) peptidase subunit